MINHNNYSQETRNQFEVVGTYFVSNFYQTLHMKARESVNEGRYNSVTAAYRAIVSHYASAIDNDASSYKIMVQRLHGFYEKHKGPTQLKKFENSFISHFIPAEFFRSMTDIQRDAAFREILLYAVKTMGNKMVSKQMLAKITDENSDRTGDVAALQEFMVTTFLLKREDYYEKFTAEVINGAKPPQVSVEIVEKMKLELIKLTKQNCSLQEDLDRTVNIIENLRVRIESSDVALKDESAKLRLENTKLNNLIADMRSRAERLDRERQYQLQEERKRVPPTSLFTETAPVSHYTTQIPTSLQDDSESSSDTPVNSFALDDDPWND